MIIVQGAESNHTGSRLENAIESEFRTRGINVFPYSYKGEASDLFANRFLLCDVRYRGMYGCDCKSEFLFKDFHGVDIRIECRWQESTGSVDEKYPYFLENAKLVPEKEVWLVVDGGGARKEAVEWLRREAGRVSTKVIRVMTLFDALKAIKKLLTTNAGHA